MNKPEVGVRLEGANVAPENVRAGDLVPSPDESLVRGTTTIYGQLERVGGAELHAVIRLFGSDERLTAFVSDSLAKELGHKLHQPVGIEGVASWRIGDWKLKEFVATRLVEYDPRSLTVAFEQLATAANGAWDGVDATRYVEALRSEVDE